MFHVSPITWLQSLWLGLFCGLVQNGCIAASQSPNFLSDIAALFPLRSVRIP